MYNNTHGSYFIVRTAVDSVVQAFSSTSRSFRLKTAVNIQYLVLVLAGMGGEFWTPCVPGISDCHTALPRYCSTAVALVRCSCYCLLSFLPWYPVSCRSCSLCATSIRPPVAPCLQFVAAPTLYPQDLHHRAVRTRARSVFGQPCFMQSRTDKPRERNTPLWTET